ncbi:universal stress protein [Mobilicoccus massiliensis]|uniref:universal stress protein n=1 Tax=Mobilicoccus massiliensis TaxID=1522310 RepID=UPI0006938AD8|nr:universal stress protein [Mobilicoccus massiliensis]
MANDDTSSDEFMTDVPTGAVVVGIDGSAPAEAALVWAATEARRRGLRLHLIFARESYAMPTGVVEGAIAWGSIDVDDGAESTLAEAQRRARALAPDVEITTSAPWGGAAQVLVSASTEAAFLVVGTRGRSRRTAAILGTVSLQTAAYAHCPVVVIRGADQASADDRPRRVVVGVDGSTDSRRALQFGFESAAPNGSVTTVTAWWLEVVDGVVVTTPDTPAWGRVVEGYEQRVAKTLGDLPQEYPGVEVDVRITRAGATEALLEAAKGADLLVVGSRGRGGFAGLMLGSVSQHMLTDATCPVAVVSRRGA